MRIFLRELVLYLTMSDKATFILFSVLYPYVEDTGYPHVAYTGF